MSKGKTRGLVYRCPVCKAEITVLARQVGDFHPRCCNVAMTLLRRRVTFFRCPRCGSEIGVLVTGDGKFEPKCCNTAMTLAA